MVDGIQELVEALQINTAEPSKTYHAEVSRIDNEGRVWVYLEGSAMETPTSTSSAEVKAGDYVNVEWRNNKLYIAGNTSNPSAGVKRVSTVEHNLKRTNKLVKVVESIAGSASKIATSINQYFWHVESGSADNGAHITQIPKEEFLADPENGGGNLLATSSGIAVRDGTTDLATFGVDGVTIGEVEKPHMTMTTGGVEALNENRIAIFNVSMDGAEGVDIVNLATGVRWTSGRLSANYYPADAGIDTAIPVNISFMFTLNVPVTGVTSSLGNSISYLNMGGKGAVNYTYSKNIVAQTARNTFSDDQITITTASNAYRFWFIVSETNADADGKKAITGYPDWSGTAISPQGQSIFLRKELTFKAPTLTFGTNDGIYRPYSVSLGRALKQTGSDQLVVGRYNNEDIANSEYVLFAVGNGTADDSRNNALTVYKNGDVEGGREVNGVVRRWGAITGEAPSDVAIATGTAWKELCNFTLTKGVWMVSIAAQFQSNATGARAISLGSSTAVAGGIVRTMRTPAASGSVTTLALSFPVEVSATSQTFYLNGYQSSGSQLTVQPRYTAVKIGTSTYFNQLIN